MDHIDNRELDPRSLESLDARGAVTRMRQAINAASIGACTHHDLEAAAQELVAELRNANEPPEQALLHVKWILAQAGLRPSHGPAEPALVVERHASVYRTVIESSIRHYFNRSDGDGTRQPTEIPRET